MEVLSDSRVVSGSLGVQLEWATIPGRSSLKPADAVPPKPLIVSPARK